MKVYNPELKFSAVKIKKIIQGNKDIGKIAHMTPYVICKQNYFNIIIYIAKSLEFLVQDLLEKAVSMSKKNGSNKLQSSNM